MNKALVATTSIIVIFVFLMFGCATNVQYYASKKSNKYHKPGCKWAKKIDPANLIKFNSPEEAWRAGYVPCEVCNPLGAGKPVEKKPTPKPEPDKTRGSVIPEWGRVTDIVDGDTVKINDGKKVWTVRLRGVNAPEKGERGHKKATEELKKLVDGRRVRLIFEGEKFGRFKRLLAYLYLPQENADLHSVEARLVLSGWVKVYRKYPCMLTPTFNKLEDKAREKKAGLWKE